MTYTKYKLTETQLRFLSQTVNKRQRNHFGPTYKVLIRLGLVTKHDGDQFLRPMYAPTDTGRAALLQARTEGW